MKAKRESFLFSHISTAINLVPPPLLLLYPFYRPMQLQSAKQGLHKGKPHFLFLHLQYLHLLFGA